MAHLKTITDAAASVSAGHVMPSQLVEECLERIDRWEPLVRGWVLVDREGALRQAAILDAELQAGRCRGPLHGIPIGIKDIINVAGMPTRAASSITSAEPVEQDAAVVRRLREAGVIILGKTVTTEFACFDPSPTRNPWNLAHTPGGSSSGSAAAVATGMCFAAVGSQTGGSIIRPAAYCGVCGLKPGFGAISRDGVVPVSEHLDHVGPLARSVGDLALVYAGMGGSNLWSAPAGDALRLNWLKGRFWSDADAETQLVFGQLAAQLSSRGIHVVERDPPFDFDLVRSHHRVIMAVGAADYHRQWFAARRSEYGPNLAALIDEGLATPDTTYQSALRHQQALKAEAESWFADCDAWIMPATPSASPKDLSTTGDPRFNSAWSYLGLPAVTLSYALTTVGMPLGLQIVGRSTQEAIQLAQWCERHSAFDHAFTKEP